MKITSHMLKTGAHLQGDGKFESINAPVMEMKLDHVIPDQLHLILRVMDVFIQAHIDTMLAYDNTGCYAHTVAIRLLMGPC